MGISITITGDKIANVIGDMEDFLNGGCLDLTGADNVPEDETPEQPAPVKQRRTRKTKAAAPAQQDAKAASLPASPAPVVAAPITAASTTGSAPQADAGAGQAAQTPAVPLGPEAVAPGGKVFEAVKAYNDKHGMEKARELLLNYGAGMVRQIKPADYEAVIVACQG